MNQEKHILEFQGVSLGEQPPYESGLEDISFTANAGELVIISVEKGNRLLPLADAAEGLIAPSRGRVIFRDEDWQSLGPDKAAAARGRIGRVFETSGWISNLNVDENITLSQRHHTLRPEEEIMEEAQKLARNFGLAEIPAGRPARLGRSILKQAEWVRAFLGEPLLIILEHPMDDAYTEVLSGLVREVETARRRGAAVLWTSDDSRVLEAGGLSPSRRYQLKNRRLYPVGSQRE